MTASLTWKALGSTRCVHCEKRFAETPDLPVVEVEATDYTGARPGYSARRPVQVTRRWHAECLAQFEEDNERYRAEAEERRSADVERPRRLMLPA